MYNNYNFLQILINAAKIVAERLHEFATDTYGSHVARTLIGLAAGVDLQSLQGKSESQPLKQTVNAVSTSSTI